MTADSPAIAQGQTFTFLAVVFKESLSRFLQCFFFFWSINNPCRPSVLDPSVLLYIPTTWHVPAAPSTALMCCLATK